MSRLVRKDDSKYLLVASNLEPTFVSSIVFEGVLVPITNIIVEMTLDFCSTPTVFPIVELSLEENIGAIGRGIGDALASVEFKSALLVFTNLGSKSWTQGKDGFSYDRKYS